MLRGITFSKNGMSTRTRSLDVISNNLANSNSIGFKKSEVFYKSLSSAKNQPGIQPHVDKVQDFSQGILRETGNPLSLAIKGNGFFTVQTADGVMLTRQGNFVKDKEGYLATSTGDHVLGERGPIYIDENFSISEDGYIFSGEDVVDRLTIANPIDFSMIEPVGYGYFQSTEPGNLQRMENVDLGIGYIEESNVNPISEMVRMIEVYRQFETNQKALQTADQSLDKAVNDVGRA